MSATPDIDIQALACEDCPAEINLEWQQGIDGRVLLIKVRHEDTCPWLFRVAPLGATYASKLGILMHYSSATADPPEVVGDEG